MNEANNQIENPHLIGTFEWHTIEAESKKMSTDHAFVWAHHPYTWDNFHNRPFSWPEGQAHSIAAAWLLLSEKGNYVKVQLCREYYAQKQKEMKARQENGISVETIRQHR